MSDPKNTILVILILVAGTFSHFAAALERSDIDVQHYSLEYSLSLDGEYVFQSALKGTTKIRFRNVGS